MRRLVLAILVALVAVAAFGVAEAAKTHSALKVALCHRTKSAKKPYVRIVVTTRAQLRAHMVHHADIVPVPAGGCPKTPLTASKGGVVLTATLSGREETPGDPDGTGTATIRTIPGLGMLCYSISVKSITLPATAAHIHLTVNGNVVVPLTAPDAAGNTNGCVNVSRTLVKAILANPAGYYVNVHTTDFPAGAIRGTLTR
jgi:CHRD domain-containing protein